MGRSSNFKNYKVILSGQFSISNTKSQKKFLLFMKKRYNYYTKIWVSRYRKGE